MAALAYARALYQGSSTEGVEATQPVVGHPPTPTSVGTGERCPVTSGPDAAKQEAPVIAAI